jgi:Fe-S cluster assembly protein SufD
MQNFEINSNQIDNIKKITAEEKNFRIKNLQFFKQVGFPNKRHEDWKFSDFRDIIDKNFEELGIQKIPTDSHKINLLKNFEHNYIFLVNGNLHSTNFNYEDKSKIKIHAYEKNSDYKISKNPLVCLNQALAENGYSLEIEKNYKLKKVLVIYNYFSKNIKNKILNTKNKIQVNENSEIHIIDYIINEFKFVNNVYENVILQKNSILKSLIINNNENDGFFYKYIKNKLLLNSECSNLIFSSGLKFNKLDIECDLVEKNSRCNIFSALFLKKNEHQEIKTLVNHLAPNCKSNQKIKKVLASESKGIYQGKIFVKNIAQKTDAYQLSKALLVNDKAEFNSKPELEIYADDVKCSHGSSSGNIDEDSLYYLMSRGLNKKESTNLLTKGFLNDILELIKNPAIKDFIEGKLEKQINEH